MNGFRIVLRPIREFSGHCGDAGYLWPRWLVLRGIGIVFVLIFAGVIVDAKALIGPMGITPVADFCELLRKIFPNSFERFIRAPSLFWISTNPAMISALGWLGLGAALALVLNRWPQIALFICWICLLSFVATWQIFSPTIIDQLMIETAFLGLFFAPPGFRPGLGSASPPRAITIFMMRWLLFRLMFGSGLIKLFAGDSHWHDFTALDVMYETSPSPTVLGYFVAHLPQVYHRGEILLTLVAELIAPLAAIMGGRRGRWFALGCWVLLQVGIQLTGNFGWLNTAAIALGILLLDDQMITAALRRFRLRSWANRTASAPLSASCRPSWCSMIVAVVLWIHFSLTIYFFAVSALNKTVRDEPDPKKRPLEYFFRDFKTANAYVPFASFPAGKYEVEFAGSNDGGLTWRPYVFRYKPQHEDRMSPFIAPWFARFESSLQLALYTNSPVIPLVATQLLLRNSDVVGLFQNDPFKDRPPGAIRTLVFKFSFTDLKTYRETGHYWIKTYETDLGPPLYLDELGRVTRGSVE